MKDHRFCAAALAAELAQLLAKGEYGPVWSEDGAAVYFTMLSEEQQGLWRYDLRQNQGGGCIAGAGFQLRYRRQSPGFGAAQE